MLKFSGDVDGAVPTDGTLAWIGSTGWKATKEWAPYMVDMPNGGGKQLGGYVEEYG